MDGSPAILAIVAGKMAISHAAPDAEKGVSIPIICKKQAEMIKKLMDISGAQVLGKGELKNVIGGHEWTYVCNDGSKGAAFEEVQMSIDYAELACGGSGIAYLYHVEH